MTSTVVRGRAGSLILGDGRGVQVPFDTTQVVLIVPTLLLAAMVLPGAFFLQYDGYGGLRQPVAAGATSNYFWTMLQIAPILMTLAFASSMVRAAHVAQQVWPDGEKETDEEEGGGSFVKEETSKTGLSGGASSLAQLARSTTFKTTRLGRTPTFKSVVGSLQKAEKMRKRRHASMAKIEEANGLLSKPTSVEVLQWLLMVGFIAELLFAGSIADRQHPLWDASSVPFLVFCATACAIGVAIALATVYNARLTLLVRAEKETPRLVAGFLARAIVTFLCQLVCFFLCGVTATNLAPAVQPIAFVAGLGEATAGGPCALITPAYLAANCSRAIDLFMAGPAPSLDCSDGGWSPGSLYTSAYSACGSAIAGIRMRTCAYGGLAINFNVLLLLLLNESTQGMDHLTLHKVVRGHTGQRTVLVGLLLLVALGCLPLFLVFMFISPSISFKSNLHSILNVTFILNLTCWALVGLLLNLEFLSSFMRYKTEYDVFISYRVNAEKRLAARLSASLKRESLRVFLDQESLEDGKPWQEGFTKGLFRSSVYALLFSDDALAPLKSLKAVSPVDNVLLEIRLARELYLVRGPNAFQVLPIFIGSYKRCHSADDQHALQAEQAADREGIAPFESLRSYELRDGASDVTVAAVEVALSKCMRELGMGHRPRSPGGVYDNLAWLLTFQGLFPQHGVTIHQALLSLSSRIKLVANRVTEAPYKPTGVVLREWLARRKRANAEAALSLSLPRRLSTQLSLIHI